MCSEKFLVKLYVYLYGLCAFVLGFIGCCLFVLVGIVGISCAESALLCADWTKRTWLGDAITGFYGFEAPSRTWQRSLRYQRFGPRGFRVWR